MKKQKIIGMQKKRQKERSLRSITSTLHLLKAENAQKKNVIFYFYKIIR